MSETDVFWQAGYAFCAACGCTLGQEEIDFECCDACGGDGFDEEDTDEDGFG